MLRTNVKASAISNLTDARYFAAWEVQWLGFNLDPDIPGALSPQAMLAMREWVDGVSIAGEFELQPAGVIRELAAMLELDAIQVGPFSEPELLGQLHGSGELIKAIVPDPRLPIAELEYSMKAFAPYSTYFLLHFDKAGIPARRLLDFGEDREAFTALASRFPVLLSVEDVEPAGLSELLDAFPLAGLAVQGGEEEKTGYKSFDELDEWFEALAVER